MLTTGYTPIFQVLKDGKDITAQLQDRLVEVKAMQTETSEVGQVEFVFDDRDWALALPQKDDQITFLMGYKETGLTSFGDFDIDEVHLFGPPRSIKVVAHAVSQSSELRIRTIKTYTDTTVGDVIKDIASQAGLTANIDSSIASIKLPTFNQNNQSGFHIIDQLARTYGGATIYMNRMVTIVKRGQASTVSGGDAGMVYLTPEDFGEWDVWIQSRAAYSGVQAAWFDKDNVIRKFEVAQTAPSRLSDFPLIGSEFSNPKAFHTLPGMFSTQEQAQAAAQAQLRLFEQLRAQATITLAKGDPTIRVHMGLNITGMRDAIDGDYLIETVTHSYKKSTGIVTSIEARTMATG
jgi:uncharacterized protein